MGQEIYDSIQNEEIKRIDFISEGADYYEREKACLLYTSIRSYIFNPEYRISLFTLYDNAFMFLMLLFGPLIFSVIAAYLFRCV